jgi:hypothetical protein
LPRIASFARTDGQVPDDASPTGGSHDRCQSLVDAGNAPLTSPRRGGRVPLLLSVAAVIQTQVPAAAAAPAGFTELTAFSGLVNPTAVRFAPDGRIFVAEKRGTIQM